MDRELLLELGCEELPASWLPLLTNQIGELTFVGLAPPATTAEPLAILRKAYDAASNDPEFIAESTKRWDLPPASDITLDDVLAGRVVFTDNERAVLREP